MELRARNAAIIRATDEIETRRRPAQLVAYGSTGKGEDKSLPCMSDIGSSPKYGH